MGLTCLPLLLSINLIATSSAKLEKIGCLKIFSASNFSQSR